MRKISLLFLITISFDALSLLPTAEYSPKGVLIFLDDSENDFEAMSQTLVIALSQNAGPIIASMNLLANVLPFYKEEIYGTDVEGVLRKIKHGALVAAHFDPKQWLIKKVNESLCVLFPHAFLIDQKISIEDVLRFDPKQISDVELKLGLMVNHMESITVDQLTRRSNAYATYFVDALTNALFCTRIEYLNRQIKQPLWSIYAVGHGIMGEKIIGMRLAEFKKMLEFFEQKIHCRLFVYSSCYAAGLNTQLIYKDAQSAVQRTYSYAIITQAITDAAIEADYKVVYDLNEGRAEVKSNQKLNSFLVNTQSETLNYQEIAKNLFALVPGGNYGPGNVPQIKLPGLEWFSVLASAKDVVSIGSILAESFDSKKKLNIVQYFKTDPKVLLLSASTVPFELVINSNNLQAIISILPGNSFQTIQKISSNRDIDIILDWFMAIDRLAARKVFFINQINDNVTHVIIDNYYDRQRLIPVYVKRAYFKSNGELYARKEILKPTGFKVETFKVESTKEHQEYQNFLKLVEKFPSQEVEPVLSDDIEKIRELFKDKEKREAARRKIEESREQMIKEALSKEYQDIIRKTREQFGIKTSDLTQIMDSLKMLEKSLDQLKNSIIKR